MTSLATSDPKHSHDDSVFVAPLTTPKTIVLIPSYNAGETLFESVASVDPRERVDVLVVDDGSRCRPDLPTLQRSLRCEGNVYLLVLEQNQGITAALNHGLNWCWERGYDFIGRLDAGDQCVGDRFRQQQQRLESDPDMCVVGGWARVVSEQGKELFILRHPTSDDDIRREIFRYNTFVHPATMFRAAALRSVGGYPDGYPALEDWACYLELMNHGKLANIGEVLVNYTVSATSISSTRQRAQAIGRVRLLWSHRRFNFNQMYGLARSVGILLFPRKLKTMLRSRIK